jgi:glycosyltransferase involved in cell wall biosynthesis
LRILLAHNYYRSVAPSGEDAVFLNERTLLESRCEIVSYERHNDDIDESTLGRKVRLGLNAAWSRKTYEELCALIHKAQPEIAHFYNTFPLITASAYAACQDKGVPVVQTVQNYRFVCPNGLLLRDGKPCEDCFGTNFLPAIRYRCYRASLPATGAVVWSLLNNRWRGTYNNLVNRYIAPTQFGANKLIQGGLPEHIMEVKPNFLPVIPAPGTGSGGYALFAGRLSSEKGLRNLLEAWKSVKGLPLKIAGEGPLREELQSLANMQNLPVEFLGCVSYSEVLDLTRDAVFLVVPSEWYEGFPMVVVQALACGTPVIASRLGSLDEIVEEGKTGLKFEAGNPQDLAIRVNELASDRPRLARMRIHARTAFEEHYTAEINYSQLMEIYQSTICDFRGQRAS